MYLEFLWVIALMCLFLPAWLLWNAWNKSRKLDSRVQPVIELLKKLVIEKKPISTIKEGFNASEDLQKIIKKNATN